MEEQNKRTHEERGYNENEIANLKTESVKYKILENLKNQEPPGSFVSAQEVQKFIDSDIDENVKKGRLYQ